MGREMPNKTTGVNGKKANNLDSLNTLYDPLMALDLENSP
jgi:hypothetical protein